MKIIAQMETAANANSKKNKSRQIVIRENKDDDQC